MMFAFCESSPRVPDSASARDLARAAQAAELAGFTLYGIPQDFTGEAASADDVLWTLRERAEMTPAVWIGYIPEPARYEALYKAALQRNVQLINTVDQYRNAEEFDRFYPLIRDLTPASQICETVDECVRAGETIGFPVFMKGAIQSLKHEGASSCIAHTAGEAGSLAERLLRSECRSRNKVIVRELVRFRGHGEAKGNFPMGREYRVFLLDGEVLGLGYYWEGDGEQPALNEAENEVVRSLAADAAARIGTPYLTVDIGQLENGRWTVIEAGDAQFSGFSRVPVLELWHNLAQRLAVREI